MHPVFGDWMPRQGSLPEAHVCELCEKSSRAIEIVHNGNERVAIAAAKETLELKCPHRVILGTDGPAGSGVQPLGILRCDRSRNTPPVTEIPGGGRTEQATAT